MGWEGASTSIPRGGGERVPEKRGTVRQSCSGRVGAVVISAFSLSCQILLMFEAHWPMKALPSSMCEAGG